MASQLSRLDFGCKQMRIAQTLRQAECDSTGIAEKVRLMRRTSWNEVARWLLANRFRILYLNIE